MRLARFGLALAALLSLLALPANAQVVSGSVRTVAPSYVNGESRPLSLTPAGELRVLADGAAASGATAAGDPLPIGCDFSSVRPTVTTGQRVTAQCTSRGLLTMAIGDSGSSAVVGVTSNTNDTVGTGSISMIVQSLSYAFDGTAFARLRGDTAGLVTQPGLVATHWSYAAASGGLSNTTTAVTIKAAAGAGVRNCISSIQLYAGTLGAGTEIALRDGAAGTVIWRGFVTTSGITMGFQLPTPVCGTANTLLEAVTLTATISGGVYVNAQGFTR